MILFYLKLKNENLKLNNGGENSAFGHCFSELMRITDDYCAARSARIFFALAIRTHRVKVSMADFSSFRVG